MSDNTPQTEVFSKDNCPYCTRAKKLLTDRGIYYTEINVTAEGVREALIARVVAASGEEPKTLPQIFLHGEYVGGFDQLAAKLG